MAGWRIRVAELRRGAAGAMAAVALACALAAILLPIPAARADDAFRRWVEALRPEALAFGIAATTFELAFRGVEPDLGIPDLILPGKPRDTRGQAEFVRHPRDYLDQKQLAGLAAQGRTLALRHAATLATIEKQLGIQPPVILAIWGRETAYGQHKSPHYAIRVLATQAWTGRRPELFRRELLFALKLLQDGHRTVEGLRSSWAGAMGLTQFMPSEFYQHAWDLDGDGRADVWSSIPDALGSAGRQLQAKGWVAGQTWGYEVRLPASVDCAAEGPGQARPLGDWQRAGVVRVAGLTFPASEAAVSAYLMAPAGGFGPAFLVLENYLVIKRYNMSDLYAVFVGNLADRIAGGAGPGGDFETPWRPVAMPATRDIEEIQTRLQAAGRPIEKIDGKIGSNTRREIGLYQRARGLAVDCWPGAAVLDSLRAAGAAPRG